MHGFFDEKDYIIYVPAEFRKKHVYIKRDTTWVIISIAQS